MQVPSIGAIRRTFAERRPLLMSVVVLGWSIKYFVTLALTHHTGPELYGVLIAALSTGAAVANLALLRSPRLQVVATAAVLVLWAVIAVGGVAGTIAHVVGPVAGHGPVDLRPRPIAAPLVFTILGSVGALALFLGQRARIRRGSRRLRQGKYNADL
jgi:4-amino-4-deoxy-L-arabinose transferase-like glycosyltransferase